MNVRRLVACICICCITISLLVTPSFALADDAYPSTFAVSQWTVGTETIEVIHSGIQTVSLTSSLGNKSVRFNTASAGSLDGQYGTFIFKFAVGSNTSFSENATISGFNARYFIEKEDGSGDLVTIDTKILQAGRITEHSPSSTTYYLPTFYAIVRVPIGYKFYSIDAFETLGYTSSGGSGKYLYFGSSVTHIPENSQLTDIYNFLESEFGSEWGAPTKELIVEILNHLENYTGRLSDAEYSYFSGFTHDYDYTNTPRTGNLWKDLAYYFQCLFHEKATQQSTQQPLSDLRSYQDDLIGTASSGLPSLLSGFRKFFSFLDLSEAVQFETIDLDMAQIGYNNYFGSQPPPFFSSDTLSNLVVNNG